MDSHLLRFQRDKIFAFVDLETEDLCTATTKPWQCTTTISKGAKIIKEIDDFIWWDDLNVSPSAAAITRFDFARYKSLAIPAEKALDRVEKYLYDPEVIVVGANNYRFDNMVFGVWRELVGRKKDYSWVINSIDIQAVFKGLQLGYKEVPTNPFERCCWMFRLANYHDRKLKSSVKFMCNYFSIPYDPDRAHDSKYDNFLVSECWNKIIYQIDI